MKIKTTKTFDKWLSKQDNAMRQRIVFRLAQIKENGYFGDSKSVGGGNKDSQKRDIAFAKQFFESKE